MIYTEVVAGLGILFALLLLIPFTFAINMFPLDFLMFILWVSLLRVLVPKRHLEGDWRTWMDCADFRE